MMLTRIITIVILFTHIMAKITIDVTSSETEKERSVNLNGQDVSCVSETERKTFGITDENLMKAVKIYFGKRPDSVFLNDPTPHGNIYEQYTWQPVNRVLKPKNYQFKSVESSPTLVLSQIFNNTSKKPATFKTLIRQDVQNVVSSLWQKNGVLNVKSKIDYSLSLLSTSFSGNVDFKYESRWGESVVKSEMKAIGTESGIEVNLAPKETLVANLVATRDLVQLEVDYEASLQGLVFANYEEPYKNHHFHAIDINPLMKAIGLVLTVNSSEVLNFDYYSRSKVELGDTTLNVDYYFVE